MKKNEIIRKTGIFAAAFLMLFGFMALLACGQSDEKIDRSFAQIAEEANKGLPIMLDSQTKLDEIVALPGKKIKYNNTLVDALAADMDIDFFKESVGRSLLATVKNNPSLESFRKKGAVFVYRYLDKSGEEIAVFEYSPEDYK